MRLTIDAEPHEVAALFADQSTQEIPIDSRERLPRWVVVFVTAAATLTTVVGLVVLVKGVTG